MHERAVCREIMDICMEAKEEYNLDVIESITLKIGIHSCIHKGQLEYLFQISKQDTCFENTQLLFEDIDYEVECLNCHQTYKPSLDKHICPYCGSHKYNVINGYDCYVDSIDGH